MSYGNLHLPDRIISSEYLNLEGKQFSKSRGHAVWLKDFLAEFDSDTLRYYLISNGPESSDANFSWTDYMAKTNNELIGNFGNFGIYFLKCFCCHYAIFLSLMIDANSSSYFLNCAESNSE